MSSTAPSPGECAGNRKADDGLLQDLSPLGWEHINLTADYVLRQNQKPEEGKFKPLREQAGP